MLERGDSILVLMSNVCYLAVILIFLVVISAGYCSLSSGYCGLKLVTWWLLVVTVRYRLLLLVPTFGMNGNEGYFIHNI